jgi:CRP-like cAMP-binding protein
VLLATSSGNALAPGGHKCEYYRPPISALADSCEKPPMHANQHGINIEALLAHVPLFNELATEEIARLARGTREITAARGDILFHKGDTPTGFYLLVYGQVKLAFTSPNGGEKLVDIIGQGQTFGEAVMFTDRPFMVYAQALVDSLLLHISKTAILDELDADPKFGRKMIAGLSMRLHHLVSDVESYSLCSGRQRIIGLSAAGDSRQRRRGNHRDAADQQGNHRLAPQSDAGALLAHPARALGERADCR